MKDDAAMGLGVVVTLLLIVAVVLLMPAIFMLIWNWQFGDIYVISYWQAFWLSIALKFLRIRIKSD